MFFRPDGRRTRPVRRDVHECLELQVCVGKAVGLLQGTSSKLSRVTGCAGTRLWYPRVRGPAGKFLAGTLPGCKLSFSGGHVQGGNTLRELLLTRAQEQGHIEGFRFAQGGRATRGTAEVK